MAALMALAAAGCEDSPSHGGNPVGPRTAAMVTPRSSWQVRARGVDSPEAAVDGSTATRAMAPEGYRSATLTIDLGQPCMLNMVTIDHGPDEMGFAQRVGVSTSMDGRTYTRRAVAPGNRRVTIVCIVTPVLARYVRIDALRANWTSWSLAEITIH